MEGSQLYQTKLWFSSTTQALINRTRSNVDAYKSAVKEYEEKEEQRQRMLQDPQYHVPPAIQGKMFDSKLGCWLQRSYPNTTSSTKSTPAVDETEDIDTEYTRPTSVATTSKNRETNVSSGISSTRTETQERYLHGAPSSKQQDSGKYTGSLSGMTSTASTIRSTSSAQMSNTEPTTGTTSPATNSSVARNATELAHFTGTPHQAESRQLASNKSPSSLMASNSKADFSQAQEAIRKALEQEDNIAAEIEKHEEDMMYLDNRSNKSRRGRKTSGVDSRTSSRTSTAETRQSRDTVSTTTHPDTNSGTHLCYSQGQHSPTTETNTHTSRRETTEANGRSSSNTSRRSRDSQSRGSKARSTASSDVDSLLTSVNDLKKDLLSLKIPTSLDALKRLRDQEASYTEDNKLAQSVSSRLQNVNRRLSRTLARRQQHNSLRLSRPRSVTTPRRIFKADKRQAFGRSYSAPPPPRARERMGEFLNTVWRSSIDDSHKSVKEPNKDEYTSGVLIPNPRSVVFEKNVPSTTVNDLAATYRRAPIQGCEPPNSETRKRQFRSRDDRLAAAFNRSFRNKYGFLQSSHFTLSSTDTKAHLKSRKCSSRSSTKRGKPTTKKQRTRQGCSGERYGSAFAKSSRYSQHDLDAMMRSARATVATRSCANSLNRKSLLRNVDEVLSAIS